MYSKSDLWGGHEEGICTNETITGVIMSVESKFIQQAYSVFLFQLDNGDLGRQIPALNVTYIFFCGGE